jgi:hypothetical protein
MNSARDQADHPRYLSDLTMLDWYSVWCDFLWGLQGTRAWSHISRHVDIDRSSYNEDADLCQQGTFLRYGYAPGWMPHRIEHEITEADIPDDPSLMPSAPEDPSCPLSMLAYQSELRDYEANPRAWRDGHQGRGVLYEYKFSLLAACSSRDYEELARSLFSEHPGECDCSMIRALQAQGVEEAYLDHASFSVQLLPQSKYMRLGFTPDGLFRGRSEFASDLTPDEYFRWRGLKMSGSHKELARALYVRGFLFSCEAPVFPQDREDKSYITPDLLVFHDGKCLVVEVDGPSHNDADQAFRDLKRDRMWLKRGFSTLRFPARKAFTRPHDCVSEINQFFSSI